MDGDHDTGGRILPSRAKLGGAAGLGAGDGRDRGIAVAARLHIPLTGALAERCGVDRLGALVDAPSGDPRVRVLLAHGAGAPKESDFLAGFAARWSAAGALVVRFDYPYTARAARDGGRRPPDRAPVLLAAHRAALARAREAVDDGAWLLAGKSMGARMATLLLAGEEDALGERATTDVAGAVLLGYPLHPARRTDALRSAHFPRVGAPLWFASGTRDPLCDLELLERERTALPVPNELYVVEGGDHDLAVPVRSGRTHGEVLDDVARRSFAWMAARTEEVTA